MKARDQHREAEDGIEATVRKRKGRGVLAQYGYVLTEHPDGQFASESPIDLHTGEPLDSRQQRVRSDTKPRADLQHIRP